MPEESELSPVDEAFDLIHDIAEKALSEDGLSPLVEKALENIHALARYKFNVLAPDDVRKWKSK